MSEIIADGKVQQKYKPCHSCYWMMIGDLSWVNEADVSRGEMTEIKISS